MFRKLVLTFALGGAISTPVSTHAQELIESYTALLSEADHFNSSGQRLTSAAAIIRQDRANYYRYGVRDADDESDGFFADEGNRAVLEQMLDRGRADPGVLSQIANGTPHIRVDVYRAGNGPFIRVTLLDQTRQLNAEQIGSYVARLSEVDHFNSSGQRLTSAAAKIRQDRANVHRYGKRDLDDENDTFFADKGNRAVLEQMLDRGRADPGVLSRIVNATPRIRVDIYRGVDGPFVRVTLLD
jgi:hypothetical protein